EGLRRKMEDALRLHRRDELLDRTRVGELAVEERDAALLALVAQRRAGRVAALDDVELLLREELLEVLHTRTPPVRPVDGDARVLGEDVLGKVAPGEAGDTGNKDAHSRGA